MLSGMDVPRFTLQGRSISDRAATLDCVILQSSMVGVGLEWMISRII